MKGKLITSQIFAIPSAWASSAALAQIFGVAPWYFTVGIWAFVSLIVIVKT